MSIKKRILSVTAALLLATVIWLPCLHLVFAGRALAFHASQGLSPMAQALATRHLQLWSDDKSRDLEMQRMRASNAEWDFMGRSFLVWSLANIGLRDPAQKPACLAAMDRIIGETLRLEQEKGMCFFLMPYAKKEIYRVQPARSLFLDGEIALMLASRRILQEKAEYKSLLTDRVNVMVAGFASSQNGFLESYPNECWTFDHVLALDAIRAADRLDGTDHSKLIKDWVAMARKKLVHPQSGMLVSSFTVEGMPLDGPEGSTLWMVAHCLQLLDEDFAREQYQLARKQLGTVTLGFGYAHEWPKSWRGLEDVDSGPIVPGFDISAGSSGMALVGASAFGDEQFLSSLVTTLDFAAFPTSSHGALKFCASNEVGDAAFLYAATLGPLWEKIKNGGTL